MTRDRNGNGTALWPFLAGAVAGVGGAVLAQALTRRVLDPRLVHGRHPRAADVPVAVLVPGVLGSQLVRADGTLAWLNLGNALGSHTLALPYTLPLREARDELRPGGLLGLDRVLPRLFGFTEYADATALLTAAGFERLRRQPGPGPGFHVFCYDWRRDLIESARRLGEELDALAEVLGNPAARFNLIGQSMGGLVARYYLRYGGQEPVPGAPVPWAGARRLNTVILVATPSGGSAAAIDTVLNGSRVGLSTTTLSMSAVASMPSVYQLLPPAGTNVLIDSQGQPVEADMHAASTWQRFGWGPFAPSKARARAEAHLPDLETHTAFLNAVLERAATFHRALAAPADTPCPVPVLVLGGDCLPTLSRAIVSSRPGAPPRFDAWTRAEARAMFEAGDGRVTRASLLASHLPEGPDDELGGGLPELSQAFIGAADHHGIYAEPSFQSVLLRRLLRPTRERRHPPENLDGNAVQ